MSSRRGGRRSTTAQSIRIAIAGCGGFAYILAQALAEGSHSVLIISSQPHPEIEEDEDLGVQVAVVNYSQRDELRYVLQGVDLVISTIAGAEQINLVDAARRARVRHFVPSEFEGSLGNRPQGNAAAQDPLNRGTADVLAALERARTASHHGYAPMQYTTFSCGVFFERFAPGGLAAYNIGHGQPGGNASDFLVDMVNNTAELVETNGEGRPVQISMTSVYDVARFVAAAVELGPTTWPREFRMRGDQMTARDIVLTCINARNAMFDMTIHEYNTLATRLQEAADPITGDWNRYFYFARLQAASNGRYYIRTTNLNERVGFQPQRFRDWIRTVWALAAEQ